MKKITTITLLAVGLAFCFFLGFFLGRQREEQNSEGPTKVIYNSEGTYDACPESVLESVVAIEVFDEKDESIANASGFIAFTEKRLVTCRHALANMSYAICTTESGETFKIDTIVEADEDSDVAVCIVPEECTIPSMTLSEKELKKGEGITAIGSWYGMVNVVARGNVGMVKDDYILITASVNPGASGGVVLDSNYEVCGMIRGSYTEGQSINVAVPIATIIDLVE